MDNEENITKSYAVIYNNDEVRENSSSGGMFCLLAKTVLEDNGIVFGAAFDKNWEVHHTYVENLQDLPKLMQSKYVQSDMGDCYKQAKEFLQQGKKVLFCGTGCQIYGLLSFLKKPYDNLLTMDFLCHGVPSRMVWRKYLEQLSKGRKIKSINFRDKTNGWRDFSLKVEFEDGSNYICSWHKDPYVQGFIKNVYLRESCYECRFRGVDRETDITVADFWRVHNLHPDMYDDRGTSILMLHSDKSKEIFERIKGELKFKEITNQTVIETNLPTLKSVPRNPKRDIFYKNFKGDSISKEISGYIKEPFFKRVKRKIRKIVKGK